MSNPMLFHVKQEPDAYVSEPNPPESDNESEENEYKPLKLAPRVGWNGEVWNVDSSDSLSEEISSTSTSVNDEDDAEIEQLNAVPSVWPAAASDDEKDDDEDIEENSRQRSTSDSDHHHQKLAKAIASKYRLGGCLSKPISSAKVNISKRTILDKETVGLIPGSFVWSLLPRRYQLPWWPAVVVARPIKRRKLAGKKTSVGDPEVPYFRILLLCSSTALPLETCLLVSQKRLRVFNGRITFEKFMCSLLASAKNKVQALRQFCIPPKFEQFWHTARNQAEYISGIPCRSLSGRFKLLGLDIIRLQAKWKAFDDQKRKDISTKSPGTTIENKKLNKSVIGKKAVVGRSPLLKKANENEMTLFNKPQVLPKDDVFAFEVLASHSHPTKARFICCICLKPGQLLKKKVIGSKTENQAKQQTTTTTGKQKKTISRVPPVLLLKRPLVLKTVKTGQAVDRRRRMRLSAPQSCLILVPCSGRCSNFLHIDCCKKLAGGGGGVSEEMSPDRSKFLCSYCKLGLRQCSICMGVQPIENNNHESDIEKVDMEYIEKGAPMQRCSASFCQRWFHSPCLRQLPFAALVRDGRAATFTCPAHSCLSCFADAPGTLPRPSNLFVHCFFCAATYHPGEWCLPAGSIKLSTSWIICPRHAIQNPQCLPRVEYLIKLPSVGIGKHDQNKPSSVAITNFIEEKQETVDSQHDSVSPKEIAKVEEVLEMKSLKEPLSVDVEGLSDAQLLSPVVLEENAGSSLNSSPRSPAQQGNREVPRSPAVDAEIKHIMELSSGEEKVEIDAQNDTAIKTDEGDENSEVVAFVNATIDAIPITDQAPSTEPDEICKRVEQMEVSTLEVTKRDDISTSLVDKNMIFNEADDSQVLTIWKKNENKETLDAEKVMKNIEEAKRLALAEIARMPLETVILPEIQRSQLSCMFRPANVSWCFICSKGGRIICCESCPASFHQECLNVGEVAEQFLCEDCMNGRLPRYGEIVWARLPPSRHLKVGERIDDLSSALFLLKQAFPPTDCLDLFLGMRWWPAEILHDRNLQPDNEGDEVEELKNTPPQRLGFFPVRLFGLYSAIPFNGVAGKREDVVFDDKEETKFPVCLWTTKSRVFPYEEGDDRNGSEESEISDSGDDSSDASMADEDPIMLTTMNHSIGSVTDMTSPRLPLGPLLLTSPTTTTTSGIHERHSSGGFDGNSLSPTRLLRRRLPTSSSKKIKKTSTKKPKKRLTAEEAKARTEAAKKRRSIYRTAVKRAAEGWKARKEKFTRHMGRTRRPDYYKPIKVNYPIGSVRVYRYPDMSDVPQCECKASDPCGLNSGCINRALLYECVPNVCPHGESCKNQCFTRREYPPQQPFWTENERGWGLKTLTAIKKGDFVNEYIGDLIDEEEANRRLRFAHENNISNFYMMQMDSQRIIDAGPKGNLSRFMNHSCQPNLNTQKWNVNGDTRVGLFAVRDIEVGTELTFNYNFCAHGQEMLNCRCGADGCVGYLGARPEPAQSAAPPTNSSSTEPTNTLTKANSANDIGDTFKPSTGTVKRSRGGANTATADDALVGDSTETGSTIEVGRHEKLCYRCGKEGIALAPAVSSSSSLSTSSNGGTIRSRNNVAKRLTFDGKFNDSNSTAPGSLISSTELLVHCGKEDCCKSYHLQCIDLERRPTGRWYCPWHHCDACGRPATVFCMRCPAAFCPGHVEGSVTVLPPRSKKEEWAQVVCLSHVDVIASYGEVSENGSENRGPSSETSPDNDDDGKLDQGNAMGLQQPRKRTGGNRLRRQSQTLEETNQGQKKRRAKSMSSSSLLSFLHRKKRCGDQVDKQFASQIPAGAN